MPKSNRSRPSFSPSTPVLPASADLPIAGPNWMEAIFNASSNAILVFNSAGILQQVNPFACSLLDMPSNTLVGKKISDLFKPEVTQYVSVLLHAKSSGPLPELESEVRTAQGKKLIVSYAAGTIPEGGFWLLLRDLTESRRLQEERMKFAALMEERSFAKAAEKRAEFLADATAVLSSTLDPQTALQKFARLAVPHFADWCTVFVRQGERIEPMVIVHEESAKIELAKEMHRRFPLDSGRTKTAVSSAITEKSLLLERITDAFLKRYTANDEQLQYYRKFKIRSYISTPLIARGSVIGAISYATAESKRHYNAADLAFSEELARRASFVMDNMTLYAEAKKAEVNLKASLAEKEVLLQEVHHRVKNNLQVITSLLNIQARHIQDPATLKVFEESKNRIRAMALIHEKMHGAHDDGLLLFDEYLRTLVTSLFRSYAPAGKTVDLILELEKLSLDIGKAVPLGLITNELVSNALKYAYNDAERGTLKIVLKKQPDSRILLEIADNGKGLPHEIDLRTSESLGLKLTNLLIRQINGTIELNGPGTRFSISFPV